MIKPMDARIYSIGQAKELAYHLVYSDGTEVRTIVGGGMIRYEVLYNGEWRANKPYIIRHNKKRNAEVIRDMVISHYKLGGWMA